MMVVSEPSKRGAFLLCFLFQSFQRSISSHPRPYLAKTKLEQPQAIYVGRRLEIQRNEKGFSPLLEDRER